MKRFKAFLALIWADVGLVWREVLGIVGVAVIATAAIIGMMLPIAYAMSMLAGSSLLVFLAYIVVYLVKKWRASNPQGGMGK